jgi:hypothetical protein
MPQFRALLTDDSIVIIYDHNMFIAQSKDVVFSFYQENLIHCTSLILGGLTGGAPDGGMTLS